MGLPLASLIVSLPWSLYSKTENMWLQDQTETPKLTLHFSCRELTAKNIQAGKHLPALYFAENRIPSN